ncbi:MAG: NADP-dependent oxidoreductase [Acetobacteraceae bacterium]|nr:NADP-dependent oxidoreductase [Acetobacteraceae bacterium]
MPSRAQPAVNRQVLLKSRPEAIPQAEHFEILETPVPEPGPGEVLVRNHYLSVDPAQRGWVSAVVNYSRTVGLGEVMRAFAVGEVIASRSPDFAVGDHVMGLFGWQEYAAVEPCSITRKVRETDLPLSASLGVLGLTGVTAYFALRELGEPKAGDTVVVSTAAGAVGSAAGQIAKVMGCHTVGITGGPAKAALCRQRFGYDAAIDYKVGDLDAAIAKAAPRGVDVYFDNTAGPISDTVMRHLAVHARIVICGTISQPTWDPWPTGPRVERHLLVKRARMQGFVLFDYQHRYEEAVAALAGWLRAGKLHYEEEVLEGIEQAPGAIARLYRGENKGKLLIRLGA